MAQVLTLILARNWCSSQRAASHPPRVFIASISRRGALPPTVWLPRVSRKATSRPVSSVLVYEVYKMEQSVGVHYPLPSDFRVCPIKPLINQCCYKTYWEDELGYTESCFVWQGCSLNPFREIIGQSDEVLVSPWSLRHRSNQIHTHLAPDLGWYWNGMDKPSGFLELGVVLMALFTWFDLNNLEYGQTWTVLPKHSNSSTYIYTRQPHIPSHRGLINPGQ